MTNRKPGRKMFDINSPYHVSFAELGLVESGVIGYSVVEVASEVFGKLIHDCFGFKAKIDGLKEMAELVGIPKGPNQALLELTAKLQDETFASGFSIRTLKAALVIAMHSHFAYTLLDGVQANPSELHSGIARTDEAIVPEHLEVYKENIQQIINELDDTLNVAVSKAWDELVCLVHRKRAAIAGN